MAARLYKGVFVPADVSDPPFNPPTDIVLDLPVPPSVNRTRRVNWAYSQAYAEWFAAADALVMAQGRRRGIGIPGKYEAHILLDERLCRLDADNGIKALIDYARRIELVHDDNRKFLRKITVEWGEAPEGCRLTIREVP